MSGKKPPKPRFPHPMSFPCTPRTYGWSGSTRRRGKELLSIRKFAAAWRKYNMELDNNRKRWT